MHPRPALVAIAFLVATADTWAQAPVFKPLLEDGSLAAWDPDVAKNSHLAVDAGVLRLTGQSGWVVTKERHSDVVLRFDAKADADSVAVVGMTTRRHASSADRLACSGSRRWRGSIRIHKNADRR